MSTTRAFDISKDLLMKSWRAVKSKSGAAGVDKQSTKDFERKLEGNLYKIWNRLSSGSYFPPPVKAATVPKKGGDGERVLGIPTVSDRVAQTYVKQLLEPIAESIFLPDSYGYRPGKSALDAVGVTRKRCWKYDWVLEFDIKGLFDNIDHDLLIGMVQKNVECKWMILYIKRWLTAPMEMEDGVLVVRTKGTPQGGVISPILANLFMHYVFDVWMQELYSTLPWCRYADDGLVHCKTERQAQFIKQKLDGRLAEYKLELHPEKTKIVCCRIGKQQKKYPNRKFDFLGYGFCLREAKNIGTGQMFLGFLPAVSAWSMKTMRKKTRSFNLRNRTDLDLWQISRIYNSTLRGWWEYYGKFYPTKMYKVFAHFNKTLVAWAMRKFRLLRGHKIRASKFVQRISKKQPHLFIHWQIRGLGWFA